MDNINSIDLIPTIITSSVAIMAAIMTAKLTTHFDHKNFMKREEEQRN
ncbi:hypothetical protein [Jeotgalicoccus sp. S0W5]|nr:hypothetical protein [Jeotgalicoccus sp. S0W5]